MHDILCVTKMSIVIMRVCVTKMRRYMPISARRQSNIFNHDVLFFSHAHTQPHMQVHDDNNDPTQTKTIS